MKYQNMEYHHFQLIIVYQMEFHKTRWFCPWNINQNFTETLQWCGVMGSRVSEG